MLNYQRVDVIFQYFSYLFMIVDRDQGANSAEASDEKPVRLPGIWRCADHSC